MLLGALAICVVSEVSVLLAENCWQTVGYRVVLEFWQSVVVCSLSWW